MSNIHQKELTSPMRKHHKFTSGSYFFSFAPTLLAFLFIWPFSGGKDVEMVAGPTNPAARCTVHVDVGDNGNTKLDMKAQSLAPPSAQSPPKNAYVVWIQPPDSDPQNMGQISPDNDQKAELKTVTSNKRFKIFITAEDQAQLKAPEGQTILSAEITENQ